MKSHYLVLMKSETEDSRNYILSHIDGQPIVFNSLSQAEEAGEEDMISSHADEYFVFEPAWDTEDETIVF